MAIDFSLKMEYSREQRGDALWQNETKRRYTCRQCVRITQDSRSRIVDVIRPIGMTSSSRAKLVRVDPGDADQKRLANENSKYTARAPNILERRHTTDSTHNTQAAPAARCADPMSGKRHAASGHHDASGFCFLCRRFVDHIFSLDNNLPTVAPSRLIQLFIWIKTNCAFYFF